VTRVRHHPPSVPTVTLYGRPGCHLCDDARSVLELLSSELGFVLDEVDIEADDDLLRRYLERIPVVCVDGEELFDFFVDEAILRRRIARVRSG
jgi:glutaredoxin